MSNHRAALLSTASDASLGLKLASEVDPPKKTAERVHATRPEFFAIGKLVEEHCHKLPDSEFWKYDTGWSDKIVARTVNPRLKGTHVQGFRMEMGMQLQDKVAAVPKNSLLRRVERLESLFNKLCLEAGSNLRITDDDLAG